jgi:hypothetical protein
MKRFLAIFLLIIIVFAAAPILAASAPISVDFTHHLSVELASIAIAAPSYRLNEWLALRRISRAQWYRLPPDEKPDVYGVGKMQRISSAADERWLKKQERKAKAKQSETAA